MIPFETFRQERLSALCAEDGWLNLTDRVEIGPGVRSVGRAQGNDLQLNAGPDHLGHIDLATNAFRPSGGDWQPFLASDGGNAQLRVGPLLLELHSDGGPAALRVRDLTLARGVEIDLFPYDPAWIIEAEWKEARAPIALEIEQKGGRTARVDLTHSAVFSHLGTEVELLATHWKSGKPMFVIRDATSGVQTYGASRFLIPDEVAKTKIVIDFNRLFNPPCAFTPYAICPLPPRQNILAFAITAGEMTPTA